MKRLFFIIIAVCSFSISCFSQSGWQIISSGTSSNLNGVCFRNLITGYVCGASGTILKTTNSGQNWFSLNSSVSYELRDICFSGDSVGYCAGYSGIIKTTNSGINWIQVFGTGMNKICCKEGLVFAGGNYGIYKSSDAGQNWVNILPSSEGVINSIYFINGLKGYGMGNNGLQRKTTNGGVNWIMGGYWGPGTYNFNKCYFLENDTGFAECYYNTGSPYYTTGYAIYRSTYWIPGSSSWSLVYSSSIGIYALTFSNNDTGYAVGGGLSGSSIASSVLKTVNRGNTWAPQTVNHNQILQDVFFIDSKKGYAVGNAGTILKTETGGVTEINTVTGPIPSGYFLHQNYPNPFNPSTTIKFDIPKSSVVRLSVYDITGKEIETLVNEKLATGTYDTKWDASKYAGGVYFCILTANNERLAVRRMVLIK